MFSRRVGILVSRTFRASRLSQYQTSSSKVFINPTEARFFSSNGIEHPASKKSQKPVDNDKSKKTIMQVVSDLEFRRLSQPLKFPTEANNSERTKIRKQAFDVLLHTPEEFADEGIRSSTKVWYRLNDSKDYTLSTYSEALELASKDNLDVVMLKGLSQSNYQFPSHLGQMENDHILPVVVMDYRSFCFTAAQADKSQSKNGGQKDIALTTTTTGDDLRRKVYQALTFILEGSRVVFTCKSRKIENLHQLISQTSEGQASAEELRQAAAAIKTPIAPIREAPKIFGVSGEKDREKGRKSRANEDEDGNNNNNNGDDGDSNGGIAGSRDKKIKLSKRDIDEKKQKELVASMTLKERINYFADVQRSLTYPVMGDVLRNFAKIATYIIMNRRIKNDPLNAANVAAAAAAADAAAASSEETVTLSKKQRKLLKEQERVLAEKRGGKVTISAKDPLGELKQEIEDAKIALEKDIEIDPIVFQTQLKKSFLFNHDGGSLDNVSKSSTLGITVSPQILNIK